MSSILSNESVRATPAESAGKTGLGAKTDRGIPRWADVLVAGAALIAATPVIGLLGIAIAITSGRPIFFRQRRVGRGFQSFIMIKLRTMRRSNDGPKVTHKGDDRITRLGRFLRATKLDELPTLLNVVRGDMALVGPRPEVPEYVNGSNSLWQKVLSVRPGITDPVTIALRNEEELLAFAAEDTETYYISELQPAKLRGYVEYLENRSVRSDIGVLCHTITAVIRNAW